MFPCLQIPQALIDQLRPGGRLVIPVGGEDDAQSLILLDKDETGVVHTRREMGVIYVPLTSRLHQLERAYDAGN